MSLFTVDRKKCNHDAHCVNECPLGIIAWDERSGEPFPVDGAEQLCINCGHCVAVCPQGALSLAAMPLGECPELPENWRLSPAQVNGLLKGRRSIRTYREQEIGRAVLAELIDTARYAPSGINRQPLSWAVISGSEKVRKAAELVIEWMKGLIAEASPLANSLHMEAMVGAWENGKDRICRAAPHLVIAYGIKDDMLAGQAGTIALTYLDLSAAGSGLGACWAGYVTMAVNAYAPLKEYAGLRKRHSCCGAMLLGYPAYAYRCIPARNPARITWK
ncbi:MAG: nitroreductase family protein [Candidatus Omnitrophica bacterium]|nr:nitroreductase family protein [Candidatus Omnitrophota bacterium]